MKIEYDEKKRLEVLSKRGLDFRDAAHIFEGFHLTKRDGRYDYNEDRFQSIGEMNGDIVFVAWTLRNDSRRVITMWKLDHGESENFRKRRDSG